MLVKYQTRSEKISIKKEIRAWKRKIKKITGHLRHEKLKKSTKKIQKMDKSYIKKQKLTKYVGKKYNFQVISLKLELEILEKLVEEYSKKSIEEPENSNEKSEGLDSTDA